MKNSKKYLVSGVVGFSLMAGSLGYVYNLDFLKEAKESAAIIENFPVTSGQANILSVPVISGQIDKKAAVPAAAGSTKSSGQTVVVNTQPSSNVSASTPVAAPAQPAGVQPTAIPSAVIPNNTAITSTPTVTPSTVASQPAPIPTPSTTTKATTTTTVKKTSSTRAS